MQIFLFCTLGIIVLMYLVFKIFLPSKGIYLKKRGKKIVGIILALGKKDLDDSWWKLLGLFDSIQKVRIRMIKEMPLSEAKRREQKVKAGDYFEIISIINNVEDNSKDAKSKKNNALCIVEREEWSESYNQQELQGIFLDFYSQEGIRKVTATNHAGQEKDIVLDGQTHTFQYFERSYEIIVKKDDNGKRNDPQIIELLLSMKNWMAWADNILKEYLLAYGQTHSFKENKTTQLEKLIKETDHTDAYKKIQTKEQLYNYFNDIFFEQKGFLLKDLTKRHTWYGTNSEDIFTNDEDIARQIRLNEKQQLVNEQTINNADTEQKSFDKKYDSLEKTNKLFIERVKGVGDATKAANSGFLSENKNAETIIVGNGAGNLVSTETIANAAVVAPIYKKAFDKKDKKADEKKDGVEEKKEVDDEK